MNIHCHSHPTRSTSEVIQPRRSTLTSHHRKTYIPLAVETRSTPTFLCPSHPEIQLSTKTYETESTSPLEVDVSNPLISAAAVLRVFATFPPRAPFISRQRYAPVLDPAVIRYSRTFRINWTAPPVSGHNVTLCSPRLIIAGARRGGARGPEGVEWKAAAGIGSRATGWRKGGRLINKCFSFAD